MLGMWEIHKLKNFSSQRIIGLELDYCVCTPCNKGEHNNCVNAFCYCNKSILTSLTDGDGEK